MDGAQSFNLFMRDSLSPAGESSTRRDFAAAEQGYFLDPATNTLHVTFPDTGKAMTVTLGRP